MKSTSAVAVTIHAVSPESIPSDAIAHAGIKSKQRMRYFRILIELSSFSERIVAGFAGANSPDLIELRNKYFAVAYLARFRTVDDGLDDLIDQVV